jgi:hypothetical protein
MSTEPHTDFDYDEIDRNLAGETAQAEADFAERNAELIRRHAERLTVHAIRELLRWLVIGDSPDVANNNYAKSKRYCVERIGRRALSAAWVIDTSLLEGKSLRQISRIPAARSKVHRLSAHVVEFKDTFGVFARGMKSEASRAAYAKSSKGNTHAKKKPRAGTQMNFLGCLAVDPTNN